MAKLSEKCNIQVPMEVLKWVSFSYYFSVFCGKISLFSLVHSSNLFLFGLV